MTVNKTPTSIDTTPSNAKGAPVGTALTDSATVDGFNPTGNVRFYLFGPDNTTCNFDQTSAERAARLDLHGRTDRACQRRGEAFRRPAISPPRAGVYQWVVDYGGDSQQHRGAEWLRQGSRHHRQDADAASTRRRRALTARRSAPRSRIRRRSSGAIRPETCVSTSSDRTTRPAVQPDAAGAPHGWIFMAGPIALVDGKASVPGTGIHHHGAGRLPVGRRLRR